MSNLLSSILVLFSSISKAYSNYISLRFFRKILQRNFDTDRHQFFASKSFNEFSASFFVIPKMLENGKKELYLFCCFCFKFGISFFRLLFYQFYYIFAFISIGFFLAPPCPQKPPKKVIHFKTLLKHPLIMNYMTAPENTSSTAPHFPHLIIYVFISWNIGSFLLLYEFRAYAFLAGYY